MPCPADCADITLVGIPDQNCDLKQRRKTPSRYAFTTCTTSFPDPLPGNIKALFDSGEIVVSMPQANFTVNDPTTEDVALDDCSPALRVINTREITSEDRYAIVKVLPTSPATTDAYFDFDFWRDKNEHTAIMRVGIIDCDGDVTFPVDENGQYLTANIFAYRIYIRATTQGGKGSWAHRISIVFNGDPFNYNSKPLFNLNDEGIIL